jgi:hypothetical protein
MPNPLGEQHDSVARGLLLLDALRLRPTGTPRTFSEEAAVRGRIADSALERFHRKPAAAWPTQGGSNAFRTVVEHLAHASGPERSAWVTEVLELLGAPRSAVFASPSAKQSLRDRTKWEEPVQNTSC